jgi:hypothetical protein
VNVRFLPALVAAAVVAVTGSKDGQTTQPATVAPSVAEASARAIVGEVVSVEGAGTAVSIRESVSSPSQKGQPAKRRNVTLQIVPTTKIFRGKDLSTAETLKPKDYVVARYLETPSGAVAQSIRAADVTPRATPTPTSDAASSAPPAAAPTK